MPSPVRLLAIGKSRFAKLAISDVETWISVNFSSLDHMIWARSRFEPTRFIQQFLAKLGEVLGVRIVHQDEDPEFSLRIKSLNSMLERVLFNRVTYVAGEPLQPINPSPAG